MSKRKVGAEEARTKLPKLLELAHQGKTTIVTRRGEPYAAVAPLDHVPTQRARGGVLALRGTGKALWGAGGGARAVRRMRDEWA
jgi:antitoxin (DNA-binding transcriptional repressor) of toxin-antitoxin stability system